MEVYAARQSGGRTCSLEALDTIQVLAEFLKSLQKEILLDYILSVLTVLAGSATYPPSHSYLCSDIAELYCLGSNCCENEKQLRCERKEKKGEKKARSGAAHALFTLHWFGGLSLSSGPYIWSLSNSVKYRLNTLQKALKTLISSAI